MKCNVCGERHFLSIEYTMGEVRAPALECANCDAIALDESVARTAPERASVRRAMAHRRAVQESPSLDDGSGVFEVEPGSRRSASVSGFCRTA